MNNQSGLDSQSTRNRVYKSKLEQLLDRLYEKGYDAGDGMSKYPKDIAILETEVKIERLITANFIDKNDYVMLEAEMELFKYKLRKAEESAAERERVARLDERKRYIEVLNLFGTPICDSLHHPKKYQHGGTESCPVVERIAKLAKYKL